MRNVIYLGIILPAALASTGTSIWIAWRGRVPASWYPRLLILGLVALSLRIVHIALWEPFGYDHSIFHRVGLDVWQGIDPYQAGTWESHPFLNPPTTLAYFAFLALLPLSWSLFVWSVLDGAMVFGLVFLSNAIFRMHSSEENPYSEPNRTDLTLLASALTLSYAAYNHFALGQLGIRVAFLLLLALWAQGRGKPILAGIGLALATMKIGTMLPFLLLFLRNKDWKTWVSLALSLLLLLVLGFQPWRGLDQCRAMLAWIALLSQPGGINDITLTGPFQESIIGLDHLSYHLGAYDPIWRSRIQLGLICLIGVVLAALIFTNRLSRNQSIALISLYSVLFLYHRNYDTVIIAPALLYAFSNARHSRGLQKQWHLVPFLLLLGLLSIRRNWLVDIGRYVKSNSSGMGNLARWLLIPSPTWLLLLAFLILFFAPEKRQDPYPNQLDTP